MHLQTSMPSPGFDPRPYGTVVSVTNHYTGWEAALNPAAYLLRLSVGNTAMETTTGLHSPCAVHVMKSYCKLYTC
ncbi:hypothetical protein TNCV_2603601 [Trichonephila clavipes]|nr:hypothetical protein TNCV_2603601 [Trichonephila clavipes]